MSDAVPEIVLFTSEEEQHGQPRDAMLLSVGHRPGLEEYHDRTIELSRRPPGAVITGDDGTGRWARRSTLFGKVLRRALRPRPTPDPAAEEQVTR